MALVSQRLERSSYVLKFKRHDAWLGIACFLGNSHPVLQCLFYLSWLKHFRGVLCNIHIAFLLSQPQDF